jgi:hypothetical protein
VCALLVSALLSIDRIQSIVTSSTGSIDRRDRIPTSSISHGCVGILTDLGIIQKVWPD